MHGKTSDRLPEIEDKLHQHAFGEEDGRWLVDELQAVHIVLDTVMPETRGKRARDRVHLLVMELAKVVTIGGADDEVVDDKPAIERCCAQSPDDPKIRCGRRPGHSGAHNALAWGVEPY